MTTNEIKREMIAARKEYVEMIKSEVLGPGSEFHIPDKEHELISVSPTSRYSVGILFPQNTPIVHDNDETVPDEPSATVSESSFEDETITPQQEHTVDHSKQSYSGGDRIGDAFDESNLDEEIGLSTQFQPSSMGLTFLAKGSFTELHGSLSYATYRRALVTDCIIPYQPVEPGSYSVPSALSGILEFDPDLCVLKLKRSIKKKDAYAIVESDTLPENEAPLLKQVLYRFVDLCSSGYVREPHSCADFTLDFSQSDYVDGDCSHKLDGAEVKVVALRRRINTDLWSITVMLVNTFPEAGYKPEHCVFQAKLKISTINNSFVFAENNSSSSIDDMDDEERSLDLLYRNKKTYGTGLGTSVDWQIDDNGTGELWTEFFPTAEVPPMNFSLPDNSGLQNSELSMKYYSDLDESSKEKKLDSLTRLVNAYKTWVDGLEANVASLDDRYTSPAIKNISECKKAYARMYSGIETLKNNSVAYSAFALANRAMFMQRIHITTQSNMASVDSNRYPGDEEIENWLDGLDYYAESDSNSRWRPFQLAFLLMDIDSVTEDSSPDRDLVDLIWFPTGGGKTEAYLGLTAFTIFYRRMVHPTESGGTAVIMRYTLRLLAAQQFTRAATLICACEYIRQDCRSKRSRYPSYSLGREPITIGLWIGGAHIPNKNSEAKEHLDALYNVGNANYLKSTKEKHSKFQVLKCPWCGTKLVKDEKDGKLVGEWGYATSSSHGGHFYMFCPHESCHFTDRLPIQIIDEDLYLDPPTLLFGTVDKFAMLPWDGNTGAFFGVDTANRPPELIIQDELHLISGALGTIVGLFETTIDAACSRKGVRPKIVASTATIRRAKEQCSALYNRDVVQFPAPGLDASDSFFAKEARIDYSKGIFGRQYLGIMPNGKTKAMTEIRMMAALLQKLYTADFPEEIKDKLWTLTVYFNSLKDLGKASTMVDDDVKDFIIRTANRMFASRRLIVSTDELTSRITTTELNETLDKLEKIEYSSANEKERRYASNVLLATNMISVGIDVARLNVMLMIGQPKLTSEYIQASSRVGRSYPGTVFVQYDATKSRDRSHYEQFRSYHESYYRYVEPTGATPFSKPARDRALHSVLVSMMRMKAGFGEDKDAGEFDKEYYSEQIKEIESYIIDRVEGINNRLSNEAKEDTSSIKREMDNFFDFWQELVNLNNDSESSLPLYFGRRYMVMPPSGDYLRLLKQFNSPSKDLAKNTLTSMRNVDISVEGSIVIWEDQ